MSEIPELTPEQVARSSKASVRKRLMLGELGTCEDVAALRRFVGVSQTHGDAQQGHGRTVRPTALLFPVAEGVDAEPERLPAPLDGVDKPDATLLER